MARIPNTRPTIIYWLIDVRPDTLIEHPRGRPFYCGKTVRDIPYRMRKHRTFAHKRPTRPVSVWLNQCGEHVYVRTMEIVPVDEDWLACERYWISTIRRLYPGGANVSDGGTGIPGYVHSAETRAKMSAAMKGKKRSLESRARMSASQKRKAPPSAATRAKLSAASKGKKHPEEVRLKRNAAIRGLKRTPESRARMSVAQTGKIISAETRAKMSAARTGKKRAPFTAEHIANMRAGALRAHALHTAKAA